MQQAISLTELNQRVSDMVSSTFDTPVWITAEISEGRTAANGHYYLELIEKHPRTGVVTARSRAVIWANRWWLLREAFERETGRAFAAGLKVQVEVLVTMHPAYGFSLDIQDIDPSFTVGDMARHRQEILRRLEEEGIIDLNRELPFPRLPQRIAVISAAGAAGYGDFCHQLRNNEGGYTFYPHLFAATMQGAKTEADIIHALDHIYRHADLFDVVVIIRGGGATADLASFDEYDLAANCAQFPLPIIVGIGHERDTTVLDRVAHTSVKTPTAVAAYLIDRMKLEGDRLHQLIECIQQTRLILTRQMDLVDSQAERLTVGLRQRLEREAARLHLMEQSVKLADPDLILRRGFSITRVNGQAVTSATSVTPGSHIETQLADGTFTSIAQ
jgi:exodeoxyribonuclease VII large subunit